MWPKNQRAQVLAEILAATKPAVRRPCRAVRRPRRAAWLAAAAVTAGLVVVPVVVDSGVAAAQADLKALAMAAVASAGPVIAGGTFHVKTEAVQHNSRIFGDGKTLDTIFLPPETLAAALQVLANVDGVDTDDVIVHGRPAVRITFSRFWWGLLDQHSMTVDRETARVISEHSSDPGGSYDLTTTLVEVVNEIPADVREDYDRFDEEGARVYE
jgi:hypothetical protein